MNGCEKYRELISRLIDDDLSQDEKSALAEHLKSCKECSALYEAFSGLSRAISDGMEPVPAAVHENIMSELRREDIKKKNTHRRHKHFIAAAACLAVIIIAAAGLGPVLSPKGAPQAAVFSLENSAEGAEAAAEEAGPSPAQAMPEGKADSTEFAALYEAGDAPTAEQEQSESAVGTRLGIGSPVGDRGSSVPVCYTLSIEKWGSFMSLLSGSPADMDETALPAAVLSAVCEDDISSLHVDVYLSSEQVYYIDRAEDAVYTAGCDYSEIEAFLIQTD